MTCVGHIIGAVVADTPEHAQRAAHGVKVTYEDLPAIITIEVTGGWAGWRGERFLFLEAPLLRSSRGDVRCRWDFPRQAFKSPVL